MKNGIYRIRNIQNNKCYIGSSASVKGFSTRWSKHRKQLERQQHHSPKLQNAWNKYGADAFIFEVLLYCDPENCLIYEQIYLDYFKPEYNISPTAASCLGVKRSPEFKRRAKIASTDRRHSYATKEKLRQMKLALGTNFREGTKHTKYTLAKMSQQQRGSRNPQAKLTEQDVIMIRKQLDQGVTQQTIANHYGVSRAMISNIKRGHSWRHI